MFANTGWYLYNHRLSLARAAQEAGYEVILVSPPDRYVQHLRDAGFEWHQLTLDRRGVNPLREAAAINRIRKLYRTLRPDVVHHFTIKPVIYGSIAARLVGVAGIVNSITGLGYVFIHEEERRSPLRGIAQALYRQALDADNVRVIFQNPVDRSTFLKRGLVREASTSLIRGSGVDIHRFSPRPEAEGDPLAVYVGRMLWDKGVEELVEAGRQLKVRGVAGKIVLVGEPDAGNPASIPEESLRAWEAEGAVEWWGRREDMPDVYAAGHVIVLPSYSEGLPRTLIEAAACGKPMIATDIPGCREVVTGGVHGLLVPVGDATALADAVERLFEDANLRRAMGAAARQKAIDEFADTLVAEKTLMVYQTLVAVEKSFDSYNEDHP